MSDGFLHLPVPPTEGDLRALDRAYTHAQQRQQWQVRTAAQAARRRAARAFPSLHRAS